METNNQILVFLTRESNLFSNFIYVISGRGYTHASIGLGSTFDSFYSFNLSGFCVEHSGRRRRKEKQRKIYYQLDVSESSYKEIKKRILECMEKRLEYKYSRLGVFLCILRIPHKFKNQYFCSQFVAELLSASGAVKLNRHSSLYFPNDFVKELEEIACNQMEGNEVHWDAKKESGWREKRNLL